MNNSKAAQDAKAFLTSKVHPESTISGVAAEIWSGCVAGQEAQSLIVQKIFEEKNLPVERIPELKQRSLIGDDTATREALSIVIETMHEGIEKASQSNRS